MALWKTPNSCLLWGVVRDGYNWGVIVCGQTHRADDLAGLVNHGDRLAERRHRKLVGEVYDSSESRNVAGRRDINHGAYFAAGTV